MIHQIELYRTIPKLYGDLHGFIEESKSRIADCATSERQTRMKYSHRIECANKALETLKALHRVLDE